MDEQQKDDARIEQHDRIEDLEVESSDAENVKGGKKLDLDEPGVEAQHNETLLRS